MGLINRIAGIPENPELPEVIYKIPIDHFWAMLYEMAQGERAQADIVERFALSVEEQGELNWIIDRYNAQPNSTAKAKFVELLNVIFVMAEFQEAGYRTNAELVSRIGRI